MKCIIFGIHGFSNKEPVTRSYTDIGKQTLVQWNPNKSAKRPGKCVRYNRSLL